jgi:hypothetical protein
VGVGAGTSVSETWRQPARETRHCSQADRQKDGSWRTFDEKGEFDGTIREEPD